MKFAIERILHSLSIHIGHIGILALCLPCLWLPHCQLTNAFAPNIPSRDTTEVKKKRVGMEINILDMWADLFF